MRRRKLGCIADDFTGASDVASFLAEQGIDTVLYNGTPSDLASSEVDAIVIALKTRTMEVSKAVDESINAVLWLKSQGADIFYIKYCSTFDSTPDGNIGPIMDEVLLHFGQQYSVLCPSLPINGRTVKDGILYVNGIPLSESTMKDHPLTPMWTSNITELMKSQSKFESLVVTKEIMKNDEKFSEFMSEKKSLNSNFYLVPDFIDSTDAELIIKRFSELTVFSGASGLIGPLANLLLMKSFVRKIRTINESMSKNLIIAGSCSFATRSQIKTFIQNNIGKSIKIIPQLIISDKDYFSTIVDEIHNSQSKNILVYSSDEIQEIKNLQRKYTDISERVENFLSDLAIWASDKGFRKFIIAGGETSGAVAKKLGYYGYYIGNVIAPGVPILTPINAKDIKIVFKSGNFGDEKFFETAINKLGGE